MERQDKTTVRNILLTMERASRDLFEAASTEKDPDKKRWMNGLAGDLKWELDEANDWLARV